MRFPRRSQRDFEDEVRAHLELEADQLVGEGLAPRDARLAARRRFGNVGAVHERFHDASGFVWLGDLMSDVRYALRMLRKTPGFTFVAVLTLALGVGANTAVFSVVQAVLLNPLPYREPERVVRLWETLPSLSQIMVSYPDYKDWKARTRVFDGLAIYSPFRTMALTGNGVPLPERVGVGLASASLFPVLGLPVALGRGIDSTDDQPGAARVALLTEGWWRQRFGAQPSIIGQRLTLDGEPYTVIGVIPPTVGLGSVDVWIPVGLNAATQGFDRSNHPGLIGIGRLKTGVTLGAMNRDLERVSSQLRAEYPKDDAGMGASGGFLSELIVHNVRPALRMLLWAVGLVLLIACVNVANLLLSRASTRRREIAVRSAMGATSSRIVRLLLVENLVLALGGGVMGVGLASAGIRTVLSLRPTGIPRLDSISLDWRVLVFAAAVSLTTGLMFGLLPARQTARVDLNDALREGGRSASAGGTANRLRALLMTLEVAMAMMLLVGAGLLIRSFSRLTSVDPGIDPNGVATVGLNLPHSKYPDDARLRSAMLEILERARAIPGVSAAGLASALPLGANVQNKITFEGHPRAKGQEPLVNVDAVTPDYFATVRMRVVAGRGIAATDIEGGPLVAVISESIARTFFPSENPIGKRLVHGAFDSRETPWIVVGVVGDVTERSLDERPTGTIYLSFAQMPQDWMSLVVRSALPAAQVVSSIRRVVADFDHDLPLSNAETMEEMLASSLGQERFTMFMLGAFAGVALLLAAVGVYGVIAYLVAQRAHEIGIRMALGAQRADIVSLVGGRVVLMAGIGVTIGLIGAVAASGLMTKLLFDVSPVDRATYAAGALALLVAAGLAALVPTWRATRVNPASAMRIE